MTIGGWIILIFGIVFFGFCGYTFYESSPSKAGRVLSIVIPIVLIIALALGMFWIFHNTAAGQRALTDQKSNLGGGLDRIVTVYTANGDVIAQYSGKIDIEANDGGYIKFDYDGNRYIYYNCFVESIAKIN